jgi:hypothetical protein
VGRVLFRDERDDVSEDIEGMGNLAKRLDAIGDARKLLGPIALKAVAYAKEMVPRKTGNLGRTIRLGQVTDTEAQIIAGGQFGVGYAQAVEHGTGLYGPKKKKFWVRPKNKKALAWGGDRRLSGSPRSGAKATAFSKGHEISGMHPRPYLGPAAQRAVAESGADAIIKVWNDAA